MEQPRWRHPKQPAEACRGPRHGGCTIHRLWASPPPVLHSRRAKAARPARPQGMEPSRVLLRRRAGH
eukprot:6578064-Pyramimonas_sp.AAC.1